MWCLDGEHVWRPIWTPAPLGLSVQRPDPRQWVQCMTCGKKAYID